VQPTEFLRGIEHFNALEFWEAHESWEALWLEAEGDLVEFYQGLIQLAAAYHHMKRGTFRGAVRLFDASLRRLAPFPEGFHGLDRAAAVEAAKQHRESAAAGQPIGGHEYPKLTLQSEHPI
jgi:uncharacterized protein